MFRLYLIHDCQRNDPILLMELADISFQTDAASVTLAKLVSALCAPVFGAIGINKLLAI